MTRDEWKIGGVYTLRFNTHKADGTPISLLGTPSVSAYLGGNLTEITTGITLSVDSDGKTGLNLLTVDTSSGYAAYTDVDFFLSAGTVDGISQVGAVVGRVKILPVEFDSIVSSGVLAGGGSSNSFTLPAGQRTNVQIGDILKPAGIPARIIATYNSSTGVGGVSASFAADPSGLAYVVFGTAPTDPALPIAADLRAALGTALTQGGAGRIAASLTKLLDVASPNLTASSINQTGDSFAVVHAGGAGDTAAIKAKTDNLPSSPAATGDAMALTSAYDAAKTYSGYRKNIGVTAFTFVMYDNINHAPATGKTVTGTRKLDAGAYAAIPGTITEIGTSGRYQVNLLAADMNGDIVALKFSAAGADDVDITIKTQS